MAAATRISLTSGVLCYAWCPIVFGHGEEAVLVTLGWMAGAAIALGFIGGIVCATNLIPMARGLGWTYGTYVVLLFVALVLIAIFDRPPSSVDAAVGGFILMLGIGAIVGAPLVAGPYAVTHYLNRNEYR